MTITHDRSYISPSSLTLIERGYATEVLHQLRFNFVYTQEQQAQNAEQAAQLSKDAWYTVMARAALRRSREMEPIMEAIADEFICYQYDHGQKLVYDSTQWDLFFWCAGFRIPTAGLHLDRDYSRFTLSFNERHAKEKRMEICGRVLALVERTFGSHPNLEIAVQYTAKQDTEKIAQAVRQAIPSLAGKKCVYRNREGRLIQVGEDVFFMKKYAKSRGYKLSPSEFLLLSWELAA